jgi:putative oxidoreductase
MGLGLLILRVVVGAVMAAHGAQKWFGWFGGYGLQGTGGWLGSLGFKPERTQAQIVAASEFIGGVLLIFGLFTPFAAASVIGVMVVAIAVAHLKSGFFNTNGGYEFNLVLIAAAAALAFTGPGRFSFDNAFDLGLRGIVWGFAAIALGGLGAALTLATRQTAAAPAPVEQESELVLDIRDVHPARLEEEPTRELYTP